MHNSDSDRSVPMTFRFRNIGPVKDAKLELGDLTIIAGRNNTGKTYIAYTLYGFLKMWRHWPDAHDFLIGQKPSNLQLPDIGSIKQQLIQESHISFPLDQNTLHRQRTYVIKRLARTFSDQALPRVFSSQRGDFNQSSIDVIPKEVSASQADTVIENRKDGGSLSIKYDGNVVTIIVENPKNSGTFIRNLQFHICYSYFLFLLTGIFPKPFILSAERFGISLFYRELDFTKNQLVDLLQKMGDEKKKIRISPYLFIDRATSRYALPIKDNIDYTRSIPDYRATKSDFHENKLFDYIKDMMEGYYGASGDDIRFISKARGKGRSFNIPLHRASSSARGLSDLYFFLRHVAKNNHLLIIDEPESHLDTANQIQLARLLARFVRAGLKVFITTHSDYLIKEINNLVMLSQPFLGKNVVFKKLKYRADDTLDPESIRAYVAESNSLTKCKIDRFGIDMPVFDKTINEINNVATDLESRLAEEKA